MTAKHHRTLLLILGALTAFGPLSIDMYLPALPTLEKAFAAQTAQVQLTLTAFFLGFAFSQLFYGPITDRFGRKPPLYVSLTVFTLASAACSFAPSVEALMALRFLQSIGACAGGVISRAVVRDLFEPQEMRRILSLLMLVTGIAPVLAPLIGGQILIRFGWQAIFWLLTLIGMACLVAVHFKLRETHPPAARRQLALGPILSRYISLLGNPTFWVNALAGGLGMAGMFAYIAGSPFVFIDLYKVPADQYGLLFGLNALGLVLASQLNVRLFRQVRPEKLLLRTIVTQCLAGLVLLTAAITGIGGLAGIAIPLFLYVACNGLASPNATTLAMAPYGRDAGAASALLGTIQFGLASLASAAVGALEPILPGAMPMASVMAACSLIGVMLYVVYSRRQVRILMPSV